jgi:hypothetical protein
MFGISEQKAAEQVRTLDRQQAEFLKYHFHKTLTRRIGVAH